jgi:long-chain acyl-CoA synthetase
VLADRLVLRRLRAIMGTRLRYMVSGSAPMPSWLLARFQAIGLLILEAYGLTENVIPVAANRPNSYRLGTVGLPMSGSEVRLADDGELWVRGPGVFRGYYGEQQPPPPFDERGFLATGDYASIDADGFITLTGRKSEIFKTSTGRRISPRDAEAAMRALPYVDHAVLLGAGRPFPVAILVVAEPKLRACAEASTETAMIELCERVRCDIAQSIAELPDYQRPGGLVITTHAFGITTGELTPNLKVRRNSIEASHNDVLDELYQSLLASKGALIEKTSSRGGILLCSL